MLEVSSNFLSAFLHTTRQNAVNPRICRNTQEIEWAGLDQLAKPTLRFRYAHTPFTEQNEGPMGTVASRVSLVGTLLPSH